MNVKERVFCLVNGSCFSEPPFVIAGFCLQYLNDCSLSNCIHCKAVWGLTSPESRITMDPGTTEDDKEEGFEMVTEDEVKEAQRNEVAEKVKAEDEKIDFALDRLEKEGVDGLGEADLR